MAKSKTESDQLNLTVVALVALVAIVGLVALVLNVASPAASGVSPAYAQVSEDGNIVGNYGYHDYRCLGGAGQESRRSDCTASGGIWQPM